MKRGCIAASLLLCVLAGVLMAEHDFFFNPEYAGHHFTRGKLGIVFHPQIPDFSTVEATFSGFRPRESYGQFMENTLKASLKRRVGFLGVEFVRDSFAVKSFPGVIGKRTAYTFSVPEAPVTLLQRHGVSFLLILSDYEVNAGVYDIQHYSRTQIEERRREYKEKHGSREYRAYEDDDFVLAHSFWYILIDVLTGKPIQYGFVGEEERVLEPTIENWSQSLDRCCEAIVSDGLLAKRRK